MSPVPEKTEGLLAEVCLTCPKRKTCLAWCEKALQEFADTMERAKKESEKLQRGETTIAKTRETPSNRATERIQEEKRTITPLEALQALEGIKRALEQTIEGLKAFINMNHQ